MKALQIAKFQSHNTASAVKVYYAIFLTILALIVVLSNSGVNSHTSGLEFSSAIFLFVAGINSFKNGFKFSQANNVSRKTFFKGLIMGILPITLFMSFFDLVVNRIYNLFILSPTNYDMIYGSYRDTGFWNFDAFHPVWIQANDFPSLIATFIWQFAAYTSIFALGILIFLIYFRSKKYVRFIISAIPIILLMLSQNIYSLLPVSFWNALGSFISQAFGWESRNPYIAVMTFLILGALFAGFSYLLTRRAVVKKS